jgi:hypothetical protein
MEEWLLYCVCTCWKSVHRSTLGHHKNSLKCNFLRVFGPPTRAPYLDSNKVYTEQCSAIKQAKAQLAELDDSTGKEARTSVKSIKKSNATTAEASPADPALLADIISEVKQAQEGADKTKAKGEQAAADMFQLYANLLSVNKDHSQADSI